MSQINNYSGIKFKKSDTSDIFTKMRFVGQKFRDKPRHSGLDLVKEFAAQIEMNKGRNMKGIT